MSDTAVPTTTRQREYTTAARELFVEMKEHPDLKGLFGEYHIQGGFVCVADYTGVQEFLIQFGMVDPLSGPQESLRRAIEVARLRPLDGASTREARLEEAERLAGAVCGVRRVISCRLMAQGSLSQHDRVEVEDMGELFALALVLRLRQKYQIREITLEAARGYLARYESHLAGRFEDFVS